MNFFKVLIIYFLFSITTIFARGGNVIPSINKVINANINSIVSIYSANYNNNNNIDRFYLSDVPEGESGSGVIIDYKGIIITNYHVIKDSNIYKAIVNDGRVFPLHLLHYNEALDLALLQIQSMDDSEFPYLKISPKTDNIKLGDSVISIGNSFGIGLSVSTGIVSAIPKSRYIGLGHLIQTDAVLNPGNSGGALINYKGEFIGLTTMIFSKTGSYSGIGFAIPSDILTLFLNRYLENKHIHSYWLGVSISSITNSLAQKVGLKIPKGVIITKILPNSPASKSELKEGDVLLNLDGEPILSSNQFLFMAAMIDNNNPIKLEIFRNKQRKIISIIPESLSNYQEDTKGIFYEKGIFQGFKLINNSYEIAHKLHIPYRPKDKVIIIEKEYYGNNKMDVRQIMEKGDSIVSINGFAITTVHELNEYIEKSYSKNISKYEMVISRKGNVIDFVIVL